MRYLRDCEYKSLKTLQLAKLLDDKMLKMLLDFEQFKENKEARQQARAARLRLIGK